MFNLAEVLSSKGQHLQREDIQDEEDEEDEQEMMWLDWDEKVEPLPAELGYVFQKVQLNERRLDLKLVLD